MRLESWEIIPRLTIGRRPVGGLTYQYDVLVCCEEQTENVACLGRVLHVPFYDSTYPLHVAEATQVALNVSRMIADDWRDGLSTRVSCIAGLNRSAMVVAATLVRLGYSMSDAIDLIRSKRGAHALSNKAFEEWIRHRLPRELCHGREPIGGLLSGQAQWQDRRLLRLPIVAYARTRPVRQVRVCPGRPVRHARGQACVRDLRQPSWSHHVGRARASVGGVP